MEIVILVAANIREIQSNRTQLPKKEKEKMDCYGTGGGPGDLKKGEGDDVQDKILLTPVQHLLAISKQPRSKIDGRLPLPSRTVPLKIWPC